MAKNAKGQEYCIIRTYSAGVFAGYVVRREGREVELADARRLWYWDGAASLSELSQYGVAKPENCKFSCAVPTVTLWEAIGILPCTKAARKSIEGVKEWEARK